MKVLVEYVNESNNKCSLEYFISGPFLSTAQKNKRIRDFRSFLDNLYKNCSSIKITTEGLE